METHESLEHLRLRAERLFAETQDAMRESLLLRVEGEYIRQRIEMGTRRTAPGPVPVQQETVTLNVLTPRERTVLELVAKGKSSREIARILQISFKTASCHRSSIMSKLSVHKSAAMVSEAYRLGLVADH